MAEVKTTRVKKVIKKTKQRQGVPDDEIQAIPNLAYEASTTGHQIVEWMKETGEESRRIPRTRDSEFTEYSEADLDLLRQAREADIVALKEGTSSKLDVFARKKKAGGAMSGFKLEHYDKVSGLDGEEDEDKLMERFRQKGKAKAEVAEGERERQRKLMELNEKMRRFDFNNIREDELEEVNNWLMRLTLGWKTLSTSLDEKMKYLERMHKKHHEEVEDYVEYADNLDRGLRGQKIMKATVYLKT